MTDLEWTMFGDASASHQAVTIGGVEYSDHDDKGALDTNGNQE